MAYRIKFEKWHLIAIIIVVIMVLKYTGGFYVLMSIVGVGPDFTWTSKCLEWEGEFGAKNCVERSPEYITSGPEFKFTSSQPSFECSDQYPDTEMSGGGEKCFGSDCPTENTIPYTDPYSGTTGVITVDEETALTWDTGNTPINCWSVEADLNGDKKTMNVGDVWGVNPYLSIELTGISAHIDGGHLELQDSVTFAFYVDEDAITAEYIDPSPLVEFMKTHEETIKVSNPIIDLGGGFLIAKSSQLLQAGDEVSEQPSLDGIPKGDYLAVLEFPRYEIGDVQNEVMPYVHFISENEDMKVLDRKLLSSNSAKKITRTLVGKTDNIELITIERNKWMQQYDYLRIETPQGTFEFEGTSAGKVVMILLLLGVAGVAAYLLFFRRR